MASIPMRALRPDEVPYDSATALQEDPDRPAFHGAGPDDYVCGRCGNVLAEAMNAAQMTEKVRVRCGRCSTVNVAEPDDGAPDAPVRRAPAAAPAASPAAGPRVLLIGATPVTEALARLAGEVGVEAVVVTDGRARPAAGDLALVAASHEDDELPALRAALAADVPYVGLVASLRRGGRVLGELRDGGMAADALARIETPAGLDIGADTPGEIALAILARIVEVRRSAGTTP